MAVIVAIFIALGDGDFDLDLDFDLDFGDGAEIADGALDGLDVASDSKKKNKH